MEKQNFMLNENVFLVKGAKEGAIYDLGSGNIYSINEISKKILEESEKGLSLKDLFRLYPGLEPREISEYLNELENLGLGRFLKKGETINKIPLTPYQTRLDFIWLELTERCNLNCLHCYANSGSTRPEETLSLGDWKRVIREAFDVGCKKCQFTGGEPLLEKKLMFDLIEEAKTIGYEEIEIFSNGVLLEDATIQKISELDIKMAVSFYDMHPEIHDRMTQRKGSFSKTLENLKKLKRADIPTRVAIVATRVNQDTLFNTIEFLKKETGIKNVGYDLARPVGRGHEPELFPDKLFEERELKKPSFNKIFKEDFSIRANGHNCFSKFLCITSTGEAIPCVMARDLVLGNVLEESVPDILEKPQTKFIRGLSMDKIEICKDCEYRYACFDCRPMAKNYGGGNLYAKPVNCHYDPYLGMWK